MNTLTKMFSLCLCLSALVFASPDAKYSGDLEPISITGEMNNGSDLVKQKLVRGPALDYEPSSRDCADSFVAMGVDPEGYYAECWDDGSGYFYFYWEGGCLALDITYSGGTLDLSSYGFTEGFYFYGFEPGVTEDFIMTFDDGSTGASTSTNGCATCEDLGQITCWDGSCAASEADCPEEGDCGDGFVIDCVDDDCCPESWIGDGFADCEDQAYGCDLTCYDNDGGDCSDSTSGGTTGGSSDCEACEFDWTNYGSECCDTAWDEYGIDCATLESNYGWDCAGCNCPGDNGSTSGGTSGGDGECAAGEVEDCDGSGECWPESWIGDGFADCTDEQAYGADLCCYDNDGGDCAENQCTSCEDGGQVTCWDGSCADSEGDCPDQPSIDTPTVCAEGTTLYDAPAVTISWDIETVCGDGICNGDEDYYNCPDDCNAPGECEDGYVTDCVDDDCCPETWIGDGLCDGEDQAWGCDLTCYDNDGGDCEGYTDGGGTTGGTTGGGECDDGYVIDCVDDDCCPESWIGDGFEDCEDQAYGCDLTCYDNDGGDCSGGTDGGGTTGGGSSDCEACEFDWTNYGSECCDTAWDEYGIDCATLESNYSWDCAGCNCPGDGEPECGDGNCTGDEDYYSCPEDCNAPGECDDGYITDCVDDDCCPESWIGDGFADCEDQAYGCDLTCYDNDGGDCGGRDTAEGARSLPSLSREGAPYSLNEYARKGAPYSRLETASAPFHGEQAAPSDREVLYNLTFESLEGTNAGFINTWAADPSLGEFTVYGWGYDDYVCVTAQACDGNACGDEVGPVCVYAGANDGVEVCEEGTGGDPCAGTMPGDANLDMEINVLDIVQIVNHILESALIEDECAYGAADWNADTEIDVLDIVQIVNVILEGRITGDASSATLKKVDGQVSLHADGYIGGVQMTLSHGANFSIKLTDEAYYADYLTNDKTNTTKLVIVAPEGKELFKASGSYSIDESSVIIANSTSKVDWVMPSELTLSRAYPNPFNPSTSLDVFVPADGFVSMNVYNVMGQLVDVIHSGSMTAGTHSMTWNASSMTSGVYFVRAESANGMSVQKVMLMK